MQEAMSQSANSPWFTLERSAVVHVASASPSSSTSSASSSSVSSSGGASNVGCGDLRRMVAENPVLVIGRTGCCMCHVARRLLLALGVNPAVRELGDEAAEEAAALIEEMAEADGERRMLPAMFPAVFIGGRLVGGLDRLMAIHISGDLVPILKKAGALWL